MQEYTLEDFDSMVGEYAPVQGSEGENGETTLLFKGAQLYTRQIEFPEDYTRGGASTRSVGLVLRQGVDGARPSRHMTVVVPKKKADEIYDELITGGPFRFPDGMGSGAVPVRGRLLGGRKARKTCKGGRKGRKGTRRH
jgi:hypothetical protein